MQRLPTDTLALLLNNLHTRDLVALTSVCSEYRRTIVHILSKESYWLNRATVFNIPLDVFQGESVKKHWCIVNPRSVSTFRAYMIEALHSNVEQTALLYAKHALKSMCVYEIHRDLRRISDKEASLRCIIQELDTRRPDYFIKILNQCIRHDDLKLLEEMLRLHDTSLWMPWDDKYAELWEKTKRSLDLCIPQVYQALIQGICKWGNDVETADLAQRMMDRKSTKGL